MMLERFEGTSDHELEKSNGENNYYIVDKITTNQMVVVGLSADLFVRPVRNVVKVISYNEYTDGEEGDISPIITSNSKNRKRRKNLRIKASNGPFASAPSITSPVTSSPSKKGKLTDEEGFTKVISRRNLRSHGALTSYLSC